MTENNANQVADWNGQSGARWVANQARLDAMVEVFGRAAIETVAPKTGERVLDVGCGAGASSLALADLVGAGGHVLGVDISEPLISRARALVPQDTPDPVLAFRGDVLRRSDNGVRPYAARASAGWAGSFRLLARRNRE
jgi:SAM-dependent methyltransferase